MKERKREGEREGGKEGGRKRKTEDWGFYMLKKNWLSIPAKGFFSMFTKIEHGKDNKCIKNKMLYLESASFLQYKLSVLRYKEPFI